MKSKNSQVLDEITLVKKKKKKITITFSTLIVSTVNTPQTFLATVSKLQITLKNKFAFHISFHSLSEPPPHTHILGRGLRRKQLKYVCSCSKRLNFHKPNRLDSQSSSLCRDHLNIKPEAQILFKTGLWNHHIVAS